MKNPVCFTCGRRTTKPERHEPGLKELWPWPSVIVCPRCHNGPGSLTDRAYEVGMIHSNPQRRKRKRREQK